MQHLVVFKLDPLKLIAEFGDLREVQLCLNELQSYIPGVNYIEIKPKHPHPWDRYEDGSKGWTHVLLSAHTSPDDLKVYADHPQHQAFQKRLAKCMLAPPLRIEMNDPKQANPSTASTSSISFPTESYTTVSGEGQQSCWMQHVVLFKLDHIRLRDEFGSLENLRCYLSELQHSIPNVGSLELKEKNPEPWPRYRDGSGGYTHVLISTHRSPRDLLCYAVDAQHKQLQRKMQKVMVGPPLRIDLVAGPSAGPTYM